MSLLPNPAHYDLALQLNACQSKSRRNGKVARLPLHFRAQINHMLEDGLTYKAIIEKLGAAGKHLNEDNLSNWRLGGYQDYLKAQAINIRAQTQIEATADLARESGHLDQAQLRRACAEMALLQYLDHICEHGAQLAKDSFQKNPAKFITLINACVNMSNATIASEKHNLKKAAKPDSTPPIPT